VKISSKLVVLIGLSIIMIGFQFVVGGFLDRKMAEHIKVSQALNRVNENLLSAIIEERTFIGTLSEYSSLSALRYLKKADEELNSLESSPGVNAADLASLKALLLKYRDAFSRLARLTNEMGAAENDFRNTIAEFNEKSAVVVQKLGEDIGIKLMKAEDVPEHLRSFLDTTRQTAFLVNRIFLILSERLLLKNDIARFLGDCDSVFSDLRGKKNTMLSPGYGAQGLHRFRPANVDRRSISFPPSHQGCGNYGQPKPPDAGVLDGIRTSATNRKADPHGIRRKDGRWTTRIWVNAWESVSGVGVLLVGIGVLRSISRRSAGSRKRQVR